MLEVVVILVIGPNSELHVVTILARYGVILDDIYVIKFWMIFGQLSIECEEDWLYAWRGHNSGD